MTYQLRLTSSCFILSVFIIPSRIVTEIPVKIKDFTLQPLGSANVTEASDQSQVLFVTEFLLRKRPQVEPITAGGQAADTLAIAFPSND